MAKKKKRLPRQTLWKKPTNHNIKSSASASFERQRQTSVPLCQEMYVWFNQPRHSYGNIKPAKDGLPECCMIFVCGSQLGESCTWYLLLKIKMITINGFIIDSYRMGNRQEIINGILELTKSLMNAKQPSMVYIYVFP